MIVYILPNEYWEWETSGKQQLECWIMTRNFILLSEGLFFLLGWFDHWW